MTEHTPGPWTACLNGTCRCKMVWCADYPVATVTSGEWGDPGETYGSVNEDTAVANARLIAASPDLLAACEAALPDVSLAALCLDVAAPGTLVDDLRGHAERFRAAIAKARGEVTL